MNPIGNGSGLGAVSTERLELRPFDAADLDELVATFVDRRVWEYPLGRGLTRDETEAFLADQLESWADRGMGCWNAVLRGTGRSIGYIGLSLQNMPGSVAVEESGASDGCASEIVEVGWRLSPEHWGKGLATEGARVALAEAFTTLDLTEVWSIVEPRNRASVRVCARLGMEVAGAAILGATERRGAVQVERWRITRSRWAEVNEAAAPSTTGS